MRVMCPHCRTVYQLREADPEAVLVCHRCGTEFGLGHPPEDADTLVTGIAQDSQTPDMFAARPADRDEDELQAGTEDALPSPVNEPVEEPAEKPLIEEQPAQFPVIVPARETWSEAADEQAGESSGETGEAPVSVQHEQITPGRDDALDEQPTETAIDETTVSDNAGSHASSDPTADDTADELPAGPPPRKRARIMPWLLVMLLLVAGGGFWFNKDAWLDDPWLRSVLLNAGLHLEIRDKDWKIVPESVSATWVQRKDGDAVLVITGAVRNLLQTDLLPPRVHFTLFARDNPDEIILERDLTITQPPLMQTIRQAPFTAPPPDNTPIGALDKRGFVLVLENLPQNSGDFTLKAIARQ